MVTKKINCCEIVDKYLINEYGDIYSNYYHKQLIPKRDKDGYLSILLCTKNGKRKGFRIATLVMLVFNGNPPKGMKDATVDHIDGNILNNHYTNLRWLERSDNSKLKHTSYKGENNPSCILTEKEVVEICELLVQGKSLKLIANLYGVDKSTISNIKRHKNWCYITSKYNFPIKKQKNKQESIKQREEIMKLFNDGIGTKDIIKMGFPNTVVYRTVKKYRN